VTLPVYVEVNMGGNRCGVEPGEPALDLARHVAEVPHLAFAGLQAYHGAAQHLRGWDERRQAIARRSTRPGEPATCWRAAASSARPSPGPAPAASNSRRRAGSIPSCNAASTCRDHSL